MALSLSKISWGFLAAGFIVPSMLQGLIYTRLLPIERTPDWVLVALWPAFGFYMASDTAIFGFLMSVLANALVYLLVGCLISFIYSRLFLRGHSPISK